VLTGSLLEIPERIGRYQTCHFSYLK